MRQTYSQWRAQLAARLNTTEDKLDAHAARNRLDLQHAFYEAHLSVDEIAEDFGDYSVANATE